jgi:hypothetical protein
MSKKKEEKIRFQADLTEEEMLKFKKLQMAMGATTMVETFKRLITKKRMIPRINADMVKLASYVHKLSARVLQISNLEGTPEEKESWLAEVKEFAKKVDSLTRRYSLRK